MSTFDETDYRPAITYLKKQAKRQSVYWLRDGEELIACDGILMIRLPFAQRVAFDRYTLPDPLPRPDDERATVGGNTTRIEGPIRDAFTRLLGVSGDAEPIVDTRLYLDDDMTAVSVFARADGQPVYVNRRYVRIFRSLNPNDLYAGSGFLGKVYALDADGRALAVVMPMEPRGASWYDDRIGRSVEAICAAYRDERGE